jgi:putative ABC transport system permease protein
MPSTPGPKVQVNRREFGNVYQHVDFEIRGKAVFSESHGGGAARPQISDSLLAAVSAVHGVAVAQGSVSGYAQFVAPDGKAVITNGAPTIGTSYNPSPQMASLHVVQGREPETSTGVEMDEGTAQKYHFKVGDRVRILLPGSVQTFTLTGVVRFGTANNLAGATIAAFTLPTAQTLFNAEGKLDAIDVLTSPGADKTTVQRAIAATLPRGVEVVTGETVANEQTNAIDQALGIFSTALLVFAFIALFVGAFTIFNTFSIIVGQRTRELAMLRIVGASRGQVFGSMLAEAAIVGLVASAGGLGLGVLGAIGLERLLSGFGFTLPSGSLVFGLRTVVAALVVGVGVTVVSAISPARRGVRIPPVAAIAEQSVDTSECSRRRVVIGSFVTVVGIGLLVLGLTVPAIQLVGLGAVGIFVGVGMVAPTVARPMASMIGRPVAGTIGIAGRLGRENAMRSPRRTAQTSAALMVGLALVATVAVFGASLSRSATSSIDEAINAQYIITSSSVGSNANFSDAVGTAVAHVSGTKTVSTVYAGTFEFKGSVSQLAAVSADHLGDTVILRVVSGRGPSALMAGDLLIDTTTANDGQPEGGFSCAREVRIHRGDHGSHRRHLQAQRPHRPLPGRRALLPDPLHAATTSGGTCGYREWIAGHHGWSQPWDERLSGAKDPDPGSVHPVAAGAGEPAARSGLRPPRLGRDHRPDRDREHPHALGLRANP